MEFENVVHRKHEKHYKKHKEGGEHEEDAKRWLDKSTVDYWRHERVYECIDPILEEDRGSKWLTVGDGRFGREAIYINEKGGEALPTDISVSLLQEAKKKII